MSQSENDQWTQGIKGLLTLNGLGNAWGDNLSPKKAGLLFKQRLKDQYVQSWEAIKAHDPRHSILAKIQNVYTYAGYLDAVENLKTRAVFTNLRLGLCSTKYGQNTVPCTHCGIPKTSEHLLLHCEKFKNERENFFNEIDKVSPSFKFYENNVKLWHILNPSVNNSIFHAKLCLKHFLVRFVTTLVKD